MYISTKHKFAFIHIPKTGGTSIKKALYEFTDKDQIKFDDEKVTDLNGYKPHIGINKSLYEKYLKYFKFVIVRNPWAWHASIYKFHKKRNTHPVMKTFKSFKEYVNALDNKSIEYHKPQVDYFMNDSNSYVDYIGKFESLQSDFNIIVENIGIPKIELPHFKNQGIYDYKKMYDNESIDIISKVCEKDIKMFNYKW